MELVGGRRSRRVWVVRHGESTWNAQGRMQRQIAHPPLTAKGIAQAYTAGYALRDKNIDRVVSSDAVRAVQTAQAISTVTATPISFDPRLRERGWAPGARPLVPARAPERLEDPTGRVYEVLAEISELGGTTAVVTHGDIVLTIIGLLGIRNATAAAPADASISDWTSGSTVPNGAVVALSLNGFRISAGLY